jgi:hypothetical protein
MTLRTTIDAIQDLAEQIKGVNAPKDYPESIERAELPLAICWPGANQSTNSQGFITSTRTYLVTFYLAKVGDGRGIAEPWEKTITLFQLAADKLAHTDNIILTSGTYAATIRTDDDTPFIDNGLEVYAYPPPATGDDNYPHYFGFQLQVAVKEQWAQT